MTPSELRNRLDRAVAARNLISELYELVGGLSAAGPVTLESVDVILKFMEQHGDLDFGLPGPLTAYVETIVGQGYQATQGYEAKLLESLSRLPTGHTVWMLNRVINATDDARERRRLIAALRAAGAHPMADAGTRDDVEMFLEHQAESE